ncbi:TRAP transporter small permease [Pannonibacter carbonis]|uniref:TRAP transporter small permease n=1 Tax=Pannonibacter carbonis TaxID=2067569 RepID=UPI000D0E5530|nr:TRAP transporter small permease subunit [Pannonibacter carbonis]
MQRLVKALRNGADYVAAAMLAAMFAVFIAQITARYLLNLPMGWSVEVCLTLWLWLVLWGSAFCLSDNEHVKFDLLYQSVSNRTRRIFSALSALAITVGLIVQLPAAWDYVDFYKIKRSATLLIPLKWVFIIFIAFSVGLILRYAFGLIAILRDRPRADRSPTP